MVIGLKLSACYHHPDWLFLRRRLVGNSRFPISHPASQERPLKLFASKWEEPGNTWLGKGVLGAGKAHKGNLYLECLYPEQTHLLTVGDEQFLSVKNIEIIDYFSAFLST
jgi:hypothetical protein